MGLIFGDKRTSALRNIGTNDCLYIDYFKLKEPPFSLTPDPRYLFMSERHREGLAHLLYGVQQPGGFVQLTGDIGTGKTTLCRCLINQLPPDTDIALVLNPRLTVIELLATICDELRIPYPPETESNKVFIDALNRRLLETHAQRRKTVLIIDEAQNLSSDVLEQIRLLTNLETSKEKLLQIILIGQPELLSLLKEKKLRQLAQRITARYHLLALSGRETYAYIQHRLFVAGRRDPLFSKPAIRSVYRISGGMPRVINIICDRALLGAYALNKRKVRAAVVRRAGRETRGRNQGIIRFRLGWTSGIFVLVTLLIAVAALFPQTWQNIFRRYATATAVISPISDRQGSLNPTGLEKRISGNDSAGGAPLSPLGSETQRLTEAVQPETSTSVSGSVSFRPQLVNILADPALPGDTTSSFASLYALWGVEYSADPGGLACKAGEAYGLECLFEVGNWPKLRRFDLPAILELVMTNGTRIRATLVELGNQTAILVIGGGSYTFALAEIDQVWEGAFILLWKPPFALNHLSRGDRGEEVRWVRRALDRLEGKNSNAVVSDLFDENLRQRVIAFQKECSLIPDGYVGNETLVRLTLALEGTNAPSISRHALQ